MLIYSEMNAIYHVDCKILIYSHEFSMKSKTWRNDVHDYVVENSQVLGTGFYICT